MSLKKYGGTTPHIYGTDLTVEPPDGTSAEHPLAEGSIWKLGGTAIDGSGYKLSAAEEGDSFNECVLGIVSERATTMGPIGFKLLNGIQQVALVPMEAPYPEVGKSVEIGASGKSFRVHLDPVTGLPSYDGITYCVRADVAALLAEVLI
jgi:hypothetical protein